MGYFFLRKAKLLAREKDLVRMVFSQKAKRTSKIKIAADSQIALKGALISPLGGKGFNRVHSS